MKITPYRDFYSPATSRATTLLAAMAVLLFLASCTGLRKLPEDEHLYKGSRIHIEHLEDFEEDRRVERELSRVLRPVPNSTFLLSRPRLWMYQVSGEPRGRGLRHWMRNRLGEEPVLFDEAALERNLRLLDNRLFNMGYFDAQVSYQADRAKRTIAVDYHVRLHEPYRILSLTKVEGDGKLVEAINKALEESILQPGMPYSLDALRRERRRIDNELKQVGYFYFHPDHILFRADTLAGPRQIRLYATVKPDIPLAATRQYRIRDILIQADYMAPASPRQNRDTLYLGEGIRFMDALQQFKPGAIKRSVYLRRDSLYKVKDHDRTLNHLMSLGVFQFINMRFQPHEEDGQGVLDVRLLLTPMERRSVSAELRGVTKSNHFAGPGINMELTNHNLFMGAESFSLSLNGAYESLVGRQRTASSHEFGLDGTLSFPRFLLPAGWKEKPLVLAPKTNMSLGINYLNRTDAFSLVSLQAQYGYVWNRNLATQVRINPLVFNLYVLGNVDKEMEGVLIGGSLLRRGLFEQFVVGGQYSFIYNSRLREARQTDWFFQANLDLSGNLAYLLMRSLPGVSPLEDGGYGLFRQSFAQYARGDVDIRHYRQLAEGHRLVSRVFLGAGIPYGNSDIMPYVKQFVIGGSNSVRAFHPRSLGPGTYSSDQDDPGGYNIYQTGELKLEANLEYRFDITTLLKGALFLDAGNIWRLQEDEEVPGGTFSTDSFYKEIALGAGTGLRIDASFFILRFDFAIPLANPALDSNGFFDPVRLHERSWRRDNLVFSLAIGYPF